MPAPAIAPNLVEGQIPVVAPGERSLRYTAPANLGLSDPTARSAAATGQAVAVAAQTTADAATTPAEDRLHPSGRCFAVGLLRRCLFTDSRNCQNGAPTGARRPPISPPPGPKYRTAHKRNSITSLPLRCRPIAAPAAARSAAVATRLSCRARWRSGRPSRRRRSAPSATFRVLSVSPWGHHGAGDQGGNRRNSWQDSSISAARLSTRSTACQLSVRMLDT